MEDQTQEQQPDPQYIKGFNNGYLLARHEPELANKLTAHPNPGNVYFDGFGAGKQEYEKEVREWSKGFSRGGHSKEDKDIQKER